MIKNLFLTLFAASCTLSYAQVQDIGAINNVLGVSYREGRVQSGTSGKSLLYDDILGTPYHDKIFREAKVAENFKNAFVRYNAFKDEVEFMANEKISVIPKEERFGRINILFTNEVLVLDNLDGNENRYYFELVKGNYSLYKKTETKYIESKQASNSYAKDKPASFSKQPTVFYIKTEGKIIQNPKNQKDILYNVSGKQPELSDFFKNNKINFKKEEDMVKLVQFLNS